MATPTFFRSSNYFLSPSDTQLELDHIFAHPSPRPFKNVDVDAPWNCPNMACNITSPHIYHNPSAILPPPSNIPTLLLERFIPANTPFPKQNIWKVQPATRFPLTNRCLVFLADFGVVSLHQAHSVVETHIVFNAHNKTGLTVAQIAVIRERVPPAASMGWRKSWKFLYNLFC